MLPRRKLAFDSGQAEADEVDVLAPGFAVVTGQRGGPGLAVGGGMLFDLLDEDGGRELEVVAQRQALPEDLEALLTDADRGGTEETEGTRGDLRGHQGMTVAVAADPGAERHDGQGVRVLDAGDVETGLLPGLAEAQVHAHDGIGKDL